MNIKENEVLVHHQGDSLKYTVYYMEEGRVVERPLNAQDLQYLVKAGLVNIIGNTGDTLSGVLKQISSIRGWGALLPLVKFKIKEFNPSELPLSKPVIEVSKGLTGFVLG